MVVHDDYAGLTVEVTIDGEALKEYEDEELELEPKTVTRYVEARAGAEFAIMCTFTDFFPHGSDVGLTIYADGNIIDRFIVVQNRPRSTGTFMTDATRRLTVNGWTEQMLCFGDISITDSTEYDLDEIAMQQFKSVGEIVIEAEFGKMGKHKSNSKSSRARGEFEVPLEVPETALKGDTRSLQLSLGTTSVSSRIDIQERRFRKTGEGPFATYKFRYRSLADLKALGILPQSPILAPSTLGDLTPQSLQAHESAIEPELERQMSCQLRQSSTSISAPVSQQQKLQNSVLPAHHSARGLTEEDLVALISHYRGNHEGLAGQGLVRLQVLLKHYEDKALKGAPTKRGSRSGANFVARIKREPEDDVSVVEARKRSKQEVIVLDD